MRYLLILKRKAVNDLSLVKHYRCALGHHKHFMRLMILWKFKKAFYSIAFQKLFRASRIQIEHFEKFDHHLEHVWLDWDTSIQGLEHTQHHVWINQLGKLLRQIVSQVRIQLNTVMEYWVDNHFKVWQWGHLVLHKNEVFQAFLEQVRLKNFSRVCNEVLLLCDLSGIHPYYRVAKESKAVLNKFVAFFKVTRVKVDIAEGLVRPPSIGFSGHVFL